MRHQHPGAHYSCAVFTLLRQYKTFLNTVNNPGTLRKQCNRSVLSLSQRVRVCAHTQTHMKTNTHTQTHTRAPCVSVDAWATLSGEQQWGRDGHRQVCEMCE